MTKAYDISAYQPLRPGTRVAVGVFDFATRQWVYSDTGTVKRWTKAMGPRDSLPAGYEPICFDTSPKHGGLMVHRDGMRVIDNRNGYAGTTA